MPTKTTKTIEIPSTTGAVLYTTEVDASDSKPLRTTVTRAILRGANLAGADLAGADLAYADLAGANLAGADLAGADLAYADLAGANLTDVNLTGANLGGATLTRAILRGATLTRADLTRATLTRADLTHATLTRAALPIAGHDARALRRAVADHIEARPEMLDQSNWGDGSADPACDTPCCVAGWTCHLGGGDRGLGVATAATLLLHVDGLPMPSFAADAMRAGILAALRA